MALQFRRYPGSQIFASTLAAPSVRRARHGGDWHDLGGACRTTPPNPSRSNRCLD